jgi:hypothetical protein
MTGNSKAIYEKSSTSLVAQCVLIALCVALPLSLAFWVMGLSKWNLSIPWQYGNTDDIWQLTLNKVLYETGWVLSNPFLGAPDIASWHHNASAQTSALHSILMLALSPLVSDAVQMQQVYYLLNFPLICLTAFLACRLLNIGRVPSLCVGLLFAFTKFHIDEMLYSYLPNYFMVPLALVAIIWTMRGDLGSLAISPATPSPASRTWKLLGNRKFLLGLLFVFLTAISDGYYSFFTLLLLGFAVLTRVLLGDWKRPVSLIPGITYILVLFATAVALQIPLADYKNAHKSEFYPNGVEDPALAKHPFEAEVYSSSLKLLLAPNEQHHVPLLGAIGKRMVSSSNEARKFERGNYWPLGFLGALALVMSFVLLAFPAFSIKRPRNWKSGGDDEAASSLRSVLLPLILFSFLMSISGGTGTLIAFVFPTIRAYERFPVFLAFLLYLGIAWYATLKLENTSGPRRFMWLTVIVWVTVFSLYDQIPRNSRKGNEGEAQRFKADRLFVEQIESTVAPRSMVYQYPYSQYLRDSKYYGWGSFSHVRLYLHSKAIHWSNGGAKNSPADDWHLRASRLPFEELLAEVEALGFKGLVIDRSVVKDDEYDTLRQILLKRGDFLREDPVSKLAFVKLKDLGVLVTYQPDYKELLQVTVTDPTAMQAGTMPRLIESDAAKKYLKANAVAPGTVLTKAAHPELFTNSVALTRGLGDTAILPITDMLGEMRCAMRKAAKPGSGAEVVLTLTNLSNFDWKLNQGAFQLRVGVHIRQADGTMLVWDNGFRTKSEPYIKRGASQEITADLNAIPMSGLPQGSRPDMFEFELVQDGSAWFNKISCSVPLG